jgi:DinB superfamily
VKGGREESDGVVRTAGDGYIVVVSARTRCEECGFRWDEVTADVTGRLTRASDALVDVLTSAAGRASRRPSPDRWSILEYAGHVRDVLISIRERIVLAVVVERPTGVAMNREERIARGLYQHDGVEDVAEELVVQSRLMVKTISSLNERDTRRTLIYSSATPDEVTVAWAIAQAIHEVEHHLGDVRENLDQLDRRERLD